MDVDPTVALTHGFPFWGVVHFCKCVLVHGQLVIWQTWRTEETTPVHEGGVDPLFLHGHGVRCCGHTFIGRYADDFHFACICQINCFGEAGGQSRDFAGQQCCHGFTACIIRDVLHTKGIFASRFHHHGCNQVVHAAWNRATADGGFGWVCVIGCHQVSHVVDGAVFVHNQSGVVADGACNESQVTEVVWENAGQGADHDWGGVHHQCAVVAVGVFDQVTNGFTAAAARHVFVRCIAHDTGFGKSFAGATCSAVPAATCAARDQEVDAVYGFFRHSLARECECCHSSGHQGATAHGQFHHFSPPN
mmetsp:Transcript_34103/g.43940  ORF Transcript_34103/g.43940 Transcript_34103/m.43940 type:complete len:305 (+) Transcript_34103:148-1062(+)